MLEFLRLVSSNSFKKKIYMGSLLYMGSFLFKIIIKLVFQCNTPKIFLMIFFFMEYNF